MLFRRKTIPADVRGRINVGGIVVRTERSNGYTYAETTHTGAQRALRQRKFEACPDYVEVPDPGPEASAEDADPNGAALQRAFKALNDIPTGWLIVQIRSGLYDGILAEMLELERGLASPRDPIIRALVSRSGAR